MNKRVLIVEDSVSMRMLITFVLSSIGCEVVRAENGEDGLAKLDGNPFNLIITDLNMPVMDGLRFINELKKKPIHHHTSILILTTAGNNEMTQQALDAGADEHLQKPFNKNRFLTVIDHLLAN